MEANKKQLALERKISKTIVTVLRHGGMTEKSEQVTFDAWGCVLVDDLIKHISTKMEMNRDILEKAVISQDKKIRFEFMPEGKIRALNGHSDKLLTTNGGTIDPMLCATQLENVETDVILFHDTSFETSWPLILECGYLCTTGNGNKFARHLQCHVQNGKTGGRAASNVRIELSLKKLLDGGIPVTLTSRDVYTVYGDENGRTNLAQYAIRAYKINTIKDGETDSARGDPLETLAQWM